MSTLPEPIAPPPSAGAHIGARALRKAAWRLIPILGAGYAVALIDRTNLGFAALQMNRDLHFSASVYGLAAGIFFLSYASCNVPANLLLLRFGARRWLAGIMVGWGILSAATLVVSTPGPFYVLRFLLGMAEAGFFPGVIYYLTRWFPSHMRARAITRFYVFGPLSGIVMGAIAGSLLGLNGRLGLAGWQWLFLVEALPAILLGAVIFAWLPDSPESAPWLAPEERAWVIRHRGGGDEPAGGASATGLGHALRDANVWVGGLFMFTTLFGFYSYIFFAPIIVTQLTGFSATTVGFLIAGQYAVAAIAMVGNGILSDRQGERRLHALFPTLLTVLGFAVAALAHSPGLILAALTLIPAGGWAAQGPAWATCMAFLRPESAAAGIGTITSLGILGGFVGPQVLGQLRDRTGTYQGGLLVCALACLAAAILIWRLDPGIKAEPPSLSNNRTS